MGTDPGTPIGVDQPQWQFDCATAEEFLDHISPWGPVLRKHELGSPTLPWLDDRAWVFRGESDVRWTLLPSALRSAKLIHPNQIRFDGTPNHTWSASEATAQSEIFLAELRTIEAFYRHAQRGGSPLPEDTAQTGALIEDWLERLENKNWLEQRNWLKDEFIWPPRELSSLFGIAQHHRIPTQLLDWSRNSFKAAFFCLEEFIRTDCSPEDSERRLAVWALKMTEPKRAENIRQMAQRAMDSDRMAGLAGETDFSQLLRPVGASKFRIIEVPTAANANLRAQEGAFLARRFIHPDGNGRFSLYGEAHQAPFDEAFAELRADPEYIKLGLSPVYRFTLPLSQAPQLLTLLRNIGVSSATLYPGFDGAKWAFEEDLWLAKASGVTARFVESVRP